LGDGDVFLCKGAADCRCPLWVDGFLADREIRQSLHTRDWKKAQFSLRQAQAEGKQAIEQSQPMGIGQATEAFLADTKARRLNEATIYKYGLLFRQLKDFAASMGYQSLRDLDVTALTAFRSEWKEGARTSLKKLERLRAFFRFAERRKWIASNPAIDLKAPAVPVKPTMPFTREEMLRILGALEEYGQQVGVANGQRLRALVLVLRYGGLRIGDAIQLGVDRINGNKLFLYTQKTGVPVHCVLPDFVVQALNASPRGSERYWFWSGQSKLHSAIGKWQRRLQKLFRLAKVPRGHAHRFRDTFAVELLLAGVPLERVSVLLGHSSTRITERHYAPWVLARQEQLEADLARAWAHDPVALLEAQGTIQVQTESERPN
jgi:integrase